MHVLECLLHTARGDSVSAPLPTDLGGAGVSFRVPSWRQRLLDERVHLHEGDKHSKRHILTRKDTVLGWWVPDTGLFHL